MDRRRPRTRPRWRTDEARSPEGSSGISDSKPPSNPKRHLKSAENASEKSRFRRPAQTVGPWYGACSLLGGLRSLVDASRRDGSQPICIKNLCRASIKESAMAADNDWSKPKALAIPKEGYFTLQQGRYGPTYPRTPACHGFTVIAKIKPGTEDDIRAYGTRIEKTIEASPHALAPLQLHYLRWVLFDIGSDKYFMYQGIFDTDFDKYTEDAIELFKATGVNTIFEKLEGFPKDWKTNAPAFIKFVREHQCPSFLEYGEYPFVTAGEIKKALALKQAFSSMLDHMQ